jgi:signal transduction histidine kinase
VLDASRIYKRLAEEKGVALVIALDESERMPGLVIGDCTRFKQIISNLVSNAVKVSTRSCFYFFFRFKKGKI